MMTEIRFLLDLVLNHKLPQEAKKICLERIGEVEASLTKPASSPHMVSPMVIQHGAPQSPSTQRLLNIHANNPGPVNPTLAPILPAMSPAPVIPVSARIVGGEVNTGSGIKGPRKF